VDGILGTGSYGDICAAIDEVMAGSGLRPCHLGNIHTAPQDGGRILSTPPWYAYLRIPAGGGTESGLHKILRSFPVFY